MDKAFTPRSDEVRNLMYQVENGGVATLDINPEVLPMTRQSQVGGYARSLTKAFGAKFHTARVTDDTGDYTLFWPEA